MDAFHFPLAADSITYLCTCFRIFRQYYSTIRIQREIYFFFAYRSRRVVAFLIGFYLIYNAIIVTLLFVTSIFSEPLLVSVEERHFKEDDVVRDHVFRVVGYTIKDSFIFIIVSLIALPLLFVPVLNIFVQIALWIWLIKDTMTYDAAALSYEKVDKEALKEHKAALWFISLVTALFNFVPILHLFGPYFGEISMFHYLKSIQKQQ